MDTDAELSIFRPLYTRRQPMNTNISMNVCQKQVIRAVLHLLSCRHTPVKLPIELTLFVIHFS